MVTQYTPAVNESFHQRHESVKYNAAIKITGGIRGTSSEKLFFWFKKLYLFYQKFHSKLLAYQKSIPENNSYASRSALNNQILFFNVKTTFSKIPFSPAVIAEWNNFDISIRNSPLCHVFKNLILKFIRPAAPNRITSTQNFEGLKLLTRMRLGLSHLAEHKFRHNFQDCLNPICICGLEIETKSYFLNYRRAR